MKDDSDSKFNVVVSFGRFFEICIILFNNRKNSIKTEKLNNLQKIVDQINRFFLFLKLIKE